MPADLVCSASDPAWLERRREGIAATDIATIAGLVTWDSPWALYHRKLGELPEVEQSDRMRLGSWLQTNVAEEWAMRHHQPSPLDAGLCRSAIRRWQLATPDFMTGNDIDDPVAPLECKTWDERQGKHEWGPDGTDEMPARIRAQVLWQMDTLGVGTGHVAVVFLPSGEFRSYTIRHDPSHIVVQWAGGEEMRDLQCAVCDDLHRYRDMGFFFWQRILRREPPDLDGLEVTTDALRYLHPAPSEQIELTAQDVFEFDRITEARKLWDDAYRRAQNMVRSAMGDAHEATVAGRVVFRRTIGKRAGYTVAPAETDTLRRIGKDKQDES